VGDDVLADRDALASMFRRGPRFGRTVHLLGDGNPFWCTVCNTYLRRTIHLEETHILHFIPMK
jgi:hypothetical protein